MSESISVNLEPGTPEELAHSLKIILGLTILVFIIVIFGAWAWIHFHGVEWTNTDSLRSSSCAYGVMKC